MASKYQDFLAPLRRLAKTSKAELAQVACFIVKNGAIVSSGVNHNPTGGPMEEMIDGKLVTKPEVVHAEVAAIKAAEINGVGLRDATLLLNVSPCIKCASEITKTDIKEVCYLHEWWDKAGLETLHQNGVKTEKLKEER